MMCDGFKKVCLGEWTQDVFQEHMRTCPECSEAFERDRKMLDMSRSLKAEVKVPDLWDRIESDLRNRRDIQTGRQWKFSIFRIAAILMLGFILGLSLVSRLRNERNDTPSGLLADSVLKNVEVQQKAYERAITELEIVASTRLVTLNQELMFLYRDRLEVIDEQIAQCREALATSHANAHIHRYLLAALQDKQETLKEIMNIETNHQLNRNGRSL
jgi:predicted anti-sigma-YlaC factor YlaD